MVNTGVIIAIILCFVLVVVGVPLGVWGSGVACPDFGKDCPASPAGTPGPASGTPGPASGTPGPASRTPGPASGTPGPASRTPSPRTPGSSLGSLTSTPDSGDNTNTPTPSTSTSTSPSTVPVPVNCEMYDWGTPTTCSKTCGGGTQTRTRSVKTPPSNGGTACPTNLVETIAGNTQPCPISYRAL